MQRFVLLATVVAGSSPIHDWRNTTFGSYLEMFEKAAYSKIEYAKRQAIFEAKLQKVVRHNEEFLAGKVLYAKGVNKFSDWTQEEFLMMLKGVAGTPRAVHTTRRFVAGQDAPDSFSWADREGVLPVPLDQGKCGSCWAFAATKAIEAHYAIQNSASCPPLSPQTFVNCVKNPDECGGTGGCGGATFEMAFNLSVATGVASTKDLPYHATDEDCQPYTPTVSVGGYSQLATNAEPSDLETAVFTLGPMAVVVAANNWDQYSSGIFHGGCINRKFLPISCDLNHAVLVVGYDRTYAKHGYWTISNSWGPSWGEHGYIRLSRENDDETFTDKSPEDGVACRPYPDNQRVRGESGILFDISYPTDVKPGALLAV